MMTARYLVPLVCLGSLFAQPAANVSKLVDDYCADCHNGVTKSPSGALLEKFDASRMSEDRVLWARAYRQLNAETMPPIDSPRPDRASYKSALAEIERGLSTSVSKAPAPSGAEIATRLAKLLWNSEPDAALLQAAKSGRLNDPAELERQVKRMLADDRAQAFVSQFFFPWLQLDQLAKANPDPKIFPDYDPSLRDAFTKETELFLLSQLREDRDPIDLWTAKYTFLNERLAKQYGVGNVSGAQFRRVALTKAERDGLLGQGSVLMATSRFPAGAPSYTSPAARSIWIRKHFLGAPNPGPFPGATPVKPELPITPQVRMLRADPCNNCHRNFFPLGYGLENFDSLGAWRTHDQAGPANAAGEYVDGSQFNGVVELRNTLLQRPDAFRTTITEKLLVYCAGGSAGPAPGTPDSLIRARKILDGMRNPRWSAIIAGVVGM